MIRVMTIVGLVGLAACTGQGGLPAGSSAPAAAAVSSALPGTAGVGDREDMDTPNSLPGTTRQGTTVGVETDIVGVTHLPP